MKQHVRIAFICACLASALSARAYADSMLTPFLGVNFGGATGEKFSDATSGNRRFDFGFSATQMSGGIFGAEADLGYTSQFYGPASAYDATRVITAMGNLVVGIPVGGQSGLGVRPYVLAGRRAHPPDGVRPRGHARCVRERLRLRPRRRRADLSCRPRRPPRRSALLPEFSGVARSPRHHQRHVQLLARVGRARSAVLTGGGARAYRRR